VSTASLHERLRGRLEALEAGALAPVLAAWHPGAESWSPTYARLRTGPGPWAVLAFASPGRTQAVRVDLDEAAAGDTLADVVRAGPLGVARLSWAADDPALPGLAAVLAALDAPALVRYRPGQRCTVSGAAPDGGVFVKVAGDAEHLHRDAVGLWAAAHAGELGFAVARPRGWDPATSAFWQDVVAGVPAYPTLLSADGPGLARRMGAALARLAGSTVAPTARTAVEDQSARTGRTAAGVVARVPSLAGRMEAVLAGFDAWHARLRPQALVPVHGAPHAHQWLLTPDDGLGLIDFDRCALGAPELDAATLLAELDSERGLAAPVADFRTALAAGYRDGGVRLDDDLVALYLAHKRLARVRRLCWSTKPDGDRRAAAQLGLVEADLRAAAG
jgi:aminoglycoside phosphotransferase (APT) family kinase protein